MILCVLRSLALTLTVLYCLAAVVQWCRAGTRDADKTFLTNMTHKLRFYKTYFYLFTALKENISKVQLDKVKDMVGAEPKNVERFTILRVILAQGPC